MTDKAIRGEQGPLHTLAKRRLYLHIAAAFAAVIIAQIYLTALAFGMDTFVSHQYYAFYIPAYISETVFGWPHDYTTNGAVRNFAWGAALSGASFDDVITAAKAVMAGQQDVFPIWNDKGGVDYVHIAFGLFGLEPSSLLKAFVLILSLSVVLFLVGFQRDRGALVLLIVLLVSIYAGTYVLGAYINKSSIAGQRALAILAVIPALHLTLLAVTDRATTAAWTALPQSGLLAFVTFVRVSAFWGVISVFLMSALVIAYRVWHSRRPGATVGHPADTRRPLAIAGILGATLVALFLHQTYNLHPMYHTQVEKSRSMWHNAYLSISLHPGLKESLPVTKGYPIDHSVRDMVKKYMSDSGRKSEWDAMVKDVGKARVVFSHRAYDGMVRDAYLAVWRARPMSMVALHLYYKPLAFFKDVARVIQRVIARAKTRKVNTTMAAVWTSLSMFTAFTSVTLLVAVFLAARVKTGMWPAKIAALSVFALSGQLPWLAAYPYLQLVLDTYVAAFAFVLGAAVIAIATALNRRVEVRVARST